MIKNLLWKQAMEAAKKKFGNLNTNEAVKFLNEQYKILVDKIDTYNKANKKAVEEFKGFKPEIVPKHDPFKNLRGNESFDELLELGEKKIKKFNPFKKEGKKIDFMDYYAKRKRGEFDEGGPVYSAEDINRRLKTLKEARQGLAPSSYLYLRDELVKDALASGLISEEDYFNKWQKPFFGERGEKWTDAIDAYEQRNFNKGGFTGSNLYFQDKHGEYDFSTRYNMMSPKEGFDQLIQDYINSTKMEEGELGKLPPIPLSALRAGLGYLLKQLAGGKFNQERRDVLEFFTKPGKPTELTNKIKYSRVKKKYKDLDKKIAEEMSKYATKHAEGGLAGMLGETQPQIQPVGLAQDREVLIRELYDAAGGFDGTGKTFSEFMADVIYEGDYIYAKGGRVSLGEGDTPSEAYLRDIFYDKFDHIGIPFDVWKNSYHATPWKEKWLSENRAEGGRAGYLKGGLLRTGIMEALDQLTKKGTRQGVDVRETILPADDVGDYAINMGDVRKLFQNLDEKFANKITSKESIDEIITRFRDTRKLDLSESIKEFLNNRIKQYKSGLENIKKYGQMGPIEEVGDHAEELRYLIKETRKDLDAIDKYGVTQQSKKATKHAEGGRAGYLKGGILKAGEFVFTTIKDLYKGKKGLQAGKIEKDLMRKYRDEGMELVDAVSKANREAYEIVDNRKLEIIEEAMKKVDTASDDYIKLVDEHIRIVEPDFYKDIKRWDSYRPDLADKTRALVHPDWAAARFGSNYDDVLLRNQNRALRQQSDEINKMYPDKTDADILVDEIDEMNKVNIDELFTGRKKNSEGGIISLKNGGAIDTLSDKYKEYSPKGPWTKGLWDMDVVYSLYETLAPFMQLFMKEGGRVGFKEGKGLKSPGRRKFMKIAAALAAMIPGVKWGAKAIKPASKVMDDIKITLRGDGDWENIDGLWSGGNWVNYSFEALTDKGKQILTKLTKGKNASLVDQGDGVYFPGKTVKAKAGDYLIDAEEYAVDAVENIKKAKGKMNLNTRVGDDVKGAKHGEKTYSGKNINKQTILDEVEDMYAHDWAGYRSKQFDNDSVETILDILDTTKKAEGGRVGLELGGTPKSLLLKWLMKQAPKLLNSPGKAADSYLKFLKDVKTQTLKGDYTKGLDAGIISGLAALLGNQYKKWVYGTEQGSFGESEYPKYSAGDMYGQNEEYWEQLAKEKFEGIKMGEMDKMKLKELKGEDLWEGDSYIYDVADRYATDKAEGGRIGLDAGGPPIMPVQLGPLQLQPRASGSFTTGQPYGPNFKEKTWTDNIGISGMLDLPGGFSLTGDYDKFRTKDRLYTADDEYVDERVRGDHDAWNVGINWKKEFADGGSVLQRPMFYQGGLTKTIPPKRGPMPQGLQSDVYDGIMRPGVINGRN